MESSSSKRVDTIILLGHTGAGKSQTANTLTGMQDLFKTSAGFASETSSTSLVQSSWFNDSSLGEVAVVDTPGLGDSNGADTSHVSAMVDKLKGKIKRVSAFAIVMNAANARLDRHLKAMLQLFNSVFSELMWNNAIVVCTHWPFDARSERERKRKKKTAEDWARELNAEFRKEFRLARDVPVVFVDNSYEEEAEDIPSSEMAKHKEQLSEFRKFVQGCDVFNCDRVEKHLCEIDRLKEEKKKVANEISMMNRKFED